MDDMLIQIANYGFPIIITIYLLIRMETRLEKLSEAIQQLNETMIKIENS